MLKFQQQCSHMIKSRKVLNYYILLLWSPQRLLPIDGANDLFYQPPPSMPTSKIYTIRPYFAKDEVGSGFRFVLAYNYNQNCN